MACPRPLPVKQEGGQCLHHFSIINLHSHLQSVALVTQAHCLHQLVLEQPCTAVRDAQPALECEGTDGALVLPHQKWPETTGARVAWCALARCLRYLLGSEVQALLKYVATQAKLGSSVIRASTDSFKTAHMRQASGRPAPRLPPMLLQHPHPPHHHPLIHRLAHIVNSQ